MNKNMIALLLAIIMAAGNIMAAPVYAAETPAEEAMPVEKEYDQETQQEYSDDTGSVEGEQGAEGQFEEIQGNEGESFEEATEGSDEISEGSDEASEGSDEASEKDLLNENVNDAQMDEVAETGSTESVMKEAELAATEEKAAAEVIGLDVDVHTESEILQFIRNNPAPLLPYTYAEEPSITVPYSPGKLSESSLEAGFNALNQMRYVAGIPAEVVNDAGCTAKAQAGSLVNAVNDELSHYPSQPEGMDDDLYQQGLSGTLSSNIAWGTNSLAESVRLWMSDSDASNIDSLGHRRWLLDPPMKKSGFGAVGSYSAVYVGDESLGSVSYSRVAWPAQNMPMEFWNSYDAWSVSFGKNITMADVLVTLTRKADGQVWTFSEDSADGYFNVENSYYGQKGCVIFRPNNISYSSGDKFDVTISGAEQADVSYTVSFFALCGENHSYTSEKLSDPTCTESGVTRLICRDCGEVTYDYAPAFGHNYQVAGETDGLYTLKCDICGDEITAAVPTSINPYWKEDGATGSYWSYFPAGLEAGDAVAYLIQIASYSAESDNKLNDITLESDDPEHCIIERLYDTSGTIRFLAAGIYTITIYPTYNPDYKITRQVKIVKPLESVTIMAEPGSPQTFGASIRLSAGVDGGKGTLYYTFAAIDGNGTERTIRSESTGSTCTWKPESAGTYSLRVDVRDAGDGDRVVSSSLLSYTVEKAVPEIQSGPQAGKAAYHPDLTLADITLTGGKVKAGTSNEVLEGSWEWTAPETPLTVPGGSYACRFVPADADNYEMVETETNVTVSKAIPFIADITAQEITYGQTLADSALTGNVQYSENDDTAVSGSFQWDDGSTAPVVSDSGNTLYRVIFTPADTYNYETVEGQTTLTVNKAKNPSEVPPSEISVPYSTDQLSNEILRTAGILNWSFSDANIGTTLEIGITTTFTISYTGSDKGNYETETAMVKVTRDACDHNGTITIQNAAEPTCTEEGWTGDKYCDICGELLEAGTAIPVIDHNWAEEYSVDRLPTCAEEGSESIHCTVCGEIKEGSTRVIEKLAHSYGEWETVKAATCTEAGSRRKVCSGCGDTITEEISAIGHDWGEWTVIREATEEEEGLERRTCRNDASHTEERSIPKLNHVHNLVKTEDQPATCTESGNLAYWTCSKCGKIYLDANGAEESSLEEVVIPAVGHSWAEEYTVDKEPTCSEEGSESIHCTVCGEIKEASTRVIEKLAHSYGEWETVKAATCTEAGSRRKVCSVCGDTVTEEISATGHDWGDWTVVREATEEEEGLERRTCRNDASHTEERSIPKLNHVHDLVKTEDKPATCTESGNISYWSCSKCGRLYLDAEGAEETSLEEIVIPAAGHDWGEWAVVREATEEEEGLERRTCRNDASHTEERSIPKLNHVHDLVKTEDKPATCTENGNLAYWTCSKCGKIYFDANGAEETSLEEIVIPAAGHDWGEWAVVREATEEEEGLERRTCRNDASHTEERSIPKLNHVHDLVKTEDKPATCTESGNLAYWTCSKCGKIYLDANGAEETNLEEIVIPAAGHRWSEEYTVDKEPTNTEEGSKSIHCGVCDAIKEGSAVSIPKLEQLGKTTRGDLFNLANNIKVTWEAVPGAKYYKVYRNGVSEPVIVTKDLVGWDNCTTPALEPGKMYTYKIVASLTGKGDPSGDSPLSYSKSIYRLKTTAFKYVKNTAPGKVTASYKKSDYGDSYVLLYADNADMKNAKSKVIYGADTTAVVLGGFTKGKTYWFQIRVRKSIAGYKLPFYTTFGTKKSVTITK